MKKFLNVIPLMAFVIISFSKPVLQKPRKDKDYALLFAVEKYDDTHLTTLKYPISNAKEIKAELENNYGFECELVINPTNRDIKKKLNEYKQKFENGTFNKDGQLLIFFSGHGERESGNGFFLAKDTKIDDLESTAFSYGLWRNKLDEIPCKHILTAIDACKSGSFDPQSEGLRSGTTDLFGRRSNELSAGEKLIKEVSSIQTRLFLSSGAMDVSTPDKSEFSYQFLAALRSKGNLQSGNNDNILTVKELSIFLESATPKPIGGKFGSDKPASNFLFIANSTNNSNTIINQAEAKNPHKEIVITSKLTEIEQYLAEETYKIDTSYLRKSQEQITLPAPSPRFTIEQRLGSASVKVEYSSVKLKGRKMFGEIIQYGEKWRTGAYQQTKVTFSHDFSVGGFNLNAGKYTLITVPNKNEWTVLLYSNADKNSVFSLDENDLAAKFKVTPQTTLSVSENFFFTFESLKPSGASLCFYLENIKISMPFAIQNTGFEPYIITQQEAGIGTIFWAYQNDKDSFDEINGVFSTSIDLVISDSYIPKGSYRINLSNKSSNMPSFIFQRNKQDIFGNLKLCKTNCELNNPNLLPYELSFDDAIMTLILNGQRCQLLLELNTRSAVEKSIAQVLPKVNTQGSFYAAGTYYFENDIDLNKALEWVDKAVSFGEKFWILRTKSLILAKQGRYKEAIETAERSLQLAKEAKNNDYMKINEKAILEWREK